MTTGWPSYCLALIAMTMALSGRAQIETGADPAGLASQPLLTRRDLPVHDPSTIIRDGDTFWTFSTGVGISASHSPDLVHWEREPAMFDPVPQWTRESIPKNRNGHFWAPDIIRLDERFLLYYSVSSFGDNRSAI
ncbi:MAG: family 43 glycosylhydrolase, partial [Gammaproteobacteria bacterium]